MKKFNLKILAADHIFYTGVSEYVALPTTNGEIGIMANHCNLVAAIVPGILRHKLDGNQFIASVSDGIVKVENGEVMVLVSTIETADEIDEEYQRRQIEELNEQMQQQQSIKDYYLSKAKLARSLARLKTKNYANKTNI